MSLRFFNQFNRAAIAATANAAVDMVEMLLPAQAPLINAAQGVINNALKTPKPRKKRVAKVVANG